MFKDMKLGARLTIGFGLILVLMGVLVTFATVKIAGLDKSIDVVVHDRMVKTRQSYELVLRLSENGRVLRNMILLEDPAKIQVEVDRRDGISKDVTAYLDSLEATITSEEGKAHLKAVTEARGPYRESMTKVVELALINDDEGATKILLGELRTAQAAYNKAMSDLIDFQSELATDDGLQAAETARATTQILIGLAIAALLLGLGAAWLITSSITSPVRRCIDIANRVARGDTDVAIEGNSTDEMGQLQAALRSMVEAIRRMGKDASQLAKAAVEGRLATRADATKHEGDFRAIVQGVNDTLDAVIGPLNVAAKAVDQISKGQIPAKISDNYNGDFNAIKMNLNQCIEAVNLLVSDASELAKAAVEGRLATRADATKHQGDFRKIVEGVNDTLDAVINPVNEAAQVLEKVAARDLTARVMGNYQGDLGRIKIAVNTAVDNLDTALSQVSQATLQVSSAAQQISAGSQSLAQGANEQASSLEEVSSSLEQMASMTRQNAESAMQAKNLSTEADGNAKLGAEAMNRMNVAIVKIKDSSDQTAKIVKTIDEIAMQTNLLALNAAVEAARAGEAGRGFAVVAEEVRNLAQRSAQAAKSTADMIGESVKNADEGVKLAQEVARSFDSIAGSSQKVNDLIAEISSASREQSQGIEQVNSAVSQMDKVTQQTAANAEESASSSEELSSQAEELQSMVAQFHISQESTAVRPVAVAHYGRAALPAPSRKQNAPKAIQSISPKDVHQVSEASLREF
jgi:methyl-accepting chemotaxis protein